VVVRVQTLDLAYIMHCPYQLSYAHEVTDLTFFFYYYTYKLVIMVWFGLVWWVDLFRGHIIRHWFLYMHFCTKLLSQRFIGFTCGIMINHTSVILIVFLSENGIIYNKGYTNLAICILLFHYCKYYSL
jgi:hypothetical protein